MKQRLIICFLVTALTQAGNSQAQLTEIYNRFDTYRRSDYVEKLYVHTDRNDYLAGELIWWKCYYLNGSSHQMGRLSNVAYLELLDRNNKPVAQVKAAIDTGAGRGSIFLPATIPSGNYRLRAYTRWMRNSGADYFFQKTIRIINPFKSLPRQPAVALRYRLEAFPESGHLVDGIPTRIAFRVTDQYGRPAAHEGKILGATGDSIASWQANETGIRSLQLTPRTGIRYQALARLADGTEINTSLPAVEEKGFTLSISPVNDSMLQLQVHTNTGAAGVLLFAHTRFLEKYRQALSLTGGSTALQLPLRSLGEGITEFILFDATGKPLCSRHYFRFPSQPAPIGVKAGGQTFHTREKIPIELNTGGQDSFPAGLSAAVVKTDKLLTEPTGDIQSWLLLSADIPHAAFRPRWYFDQPAPLATAAMDELMLTVSNTRFSWNNRSIAASPVFPPEYDGQIIEAKITDAGSGQPVTDLPVTLSVLGGKTQYYEATSDAAGRCRFQVQDFYGAGNIVLAGEKKPGQGYRFELADPFATEAGSDSLPPFEIDAALAADLQEASLAMQVRNRFNEEQINRFLLPAIDSMPFYGHRGVSVYWLDKYVRFTTMEEVLREYVIELAIRQRQGKPQILIVDVLNQSLLSAEPLLLLDGIPVTTADILAYDPLQVKKLEVMPGRYFLDGQLYEGIAAFSTYKGDAVLLKLPNNAVTAEYDGLLLERAFYAPQYNSPTDAARRMPDYRTQLYWNNRVQPHTSKSLDIFSSDIPGKYLLTIEGVDAAGKTHTGSYSIDISEKP